MTKSSEPYLRDLDFRGVVEGITYLDKKSQPLCHFFGGIPYALPPLGSFRWSKPRPLPSCYRYGTRANPGRYTEKCSLCPQPEFNDDLKDELWNEDCLQSNIWIPTGDPPKGGWPVLLWIHGGFLQFGSPNEEDLRAMLSETDCKALVVCPAYRLNIFGFLASPELLEASSDYSANVGFWDQRLALEWTWQNISYFGGNPSNITIGGYSAGSHSVFHQLAYDLNLPDSKSIVRRALMLSNGPGLQPKPLADAQPQFTELLSALQIPLSLSATEKLAQLRALSPKTLIQATQRLKHHQFRAVTDNTFIQPDLLASLDNGVFAHRMRHRNIHLITGECADEHHVYGTWRPPANNYASLLRRLQADYPPEACTALLQYYFPGRKLPPGYRSWQHAFGRLYADIQIHHLHRGMLAGLARHGAGHLVHRYRIEWRAQSCDARWPRAWGVTHGTDMKIWFWGAGDALSGAEKRVVRDAFHAHLARFLRGEDVQWGTEHGLQVRTLGADGTVRIEEDGERMAEGVRVWEVVRRAGEKGVERSAKL
ncbi:paraben-hydrolyzing esterase precursor [Massariosphaeria phaeospora]|uniref:Carboxylic ester hydrolase n=1 Tax=Massariosphaeria phaeospora TaxID=100035 RepID=A0A7C8MIU6_9PLEO|nr:paraben-hydrolyzing esterase precursor [Massariosphaeria phaeospora]